MHYKRCGNVMPEKINVRLNRICFLLENVFSESYNYFIQQLYGLCYFLKQVKNASSGQNKTAFVY